MEANDRPLKVLVVDDDPTDREVIGRMLRREKERFEVFEAEDGDAGLAALRDESPDCVLLDYQLPDMDGSEFLAQVAEYAGKHVPPVIILTGQPGDRVAVENIKLGAESFLIKSEVDEQSLFEAIEVAVTLAAQSGRTTPAIECRVLVIDDSPEDRDMYRRLLGSDTSRRYVFVETDIGEFPREVYEKASPHCILLDYQLPDLDGVECLTRIRDEIVQGPLPAVLMLTGQGNERIAVEALKCGAHDYLIKRDLNAQKLQRAVAGAIEKAILEKHLARKFHELSLANRALRDKTKELQTLNIQLRESNKAREEAHHALDDAQSQLILAGKLAALGQFAAGVAHEMNQPLLTARVSAQLLAEELGPMLTGETLDTVETIVACATRLGKIVDGVRTFGRQTGSQREVCLARAPVDGALRICGEQLRVQGIDVFVRGDENSTVYADRMQLEQVFLNLFANSRDALLGCQADKKRIEVLVSELDGAVEYTFRDNGPGIREDIAHKLFDPFFTTKGPAGGMGLGLSLSHGIVREHHGVFECRPKSDGAWFVIRLPTVREKSTEEQG